MIIKTLSESRTTKHVAGLMFQCGDCGEVLPVKTEGGTGYGCASRDDSAPVICYACCSKRELQSWQSEGKGVAYIVKREDGYHVTDWPGGIDRRVLEYRESFHNFAGRNGRRDFWFTMPNDQFLWHGVNIGWGQIARIRRTKSKHHGA